MTLPVGKLVRSALITATSGASCTWVCWVVLGTICFPTGEIRAQGLESKASWSFVSLTAERISKLPASEQKQWESYLSRSIENATRERELLAKEVEKVGLKSSTPAPNGKEFEVPTSERSEWLAESIRRKLPETILSYQTPTGGWSKAIDYSRGPRPLGTHWTSQSGLGWHYCGTLDNRSTTEQIRYLAEVATLAGRKDCEEGAVRGIEWLLVAQYPNGGWPQVYPVEKGYHEAITLNDGAMQHVLEVLLAVSQGQTPYAFTNADLRLRAKEALSRGLECVVRMQVMIDGKPAVWCAQHDPISLEPTGARLKEPPSLSGAESADLVKFLMRSAPDSPEIRQVIESSVSWFRAHRIVDVVAQKTSDGKTEYVPGTNSDEMLWARFYDLKTQLPIFAGAQDGIIYSSFAEMARKNKVAYNYFSTRPRDVITKEYVRWQKRLQGK